MVLREILHAHLPTLSKEATVRDAVDKMDIYQFPGLIFVDADKKPIAVVTEGDICRAVVQSQSAISLMNDPAITYATKEPKTADVSAEISDALHEMLSRGLTLLPVTDEGVLAGVVLRVDLMQAMMMDAAQA